MERYLIRYLYETTSDARKRRFLDYLKIKLDVRLWSMGNHVPYSFDYQCSLKQWKKAHSKEISIRKRLKRYIRSWIFSRIRASLVAQVADHHISQYEYKVLSLIENLPKQTIELFEQKGIRIYQLSDWTSPTTYIYKIQKWYESLDEMSFNSLLTNEHYQELDELFNGLLKELRDENFDALLVRTSELFYEKCFIDIFKELGRPSITLLHGLPGVYTLATESRSDYLLVYGKQIKKNFEAVGYNPSRVLVAGNYKYCDTKTIDGKLRCGLDNVLVLTSGTYIEFQHEWEWSKFPIQDRSVLITYLYSIESVLRRVGVNHARLRPHPAISKEWLSDYINMDFYELDYDDLISSLSKATLCIGQTSTTFIEAIMCGVNYLVYEPGDGVYTMINALLVPPFNGTDNRLKVAYSEEDLEKMILQYYRPDISLLDDYLQPFDVDVVKRLILQHVDIQYVIGGGRRTI